LNLNERMTSCLNFQEVEISLLLANVLLHTPSLSLNPLTLPSH